MVLHLVTAVDVQGDSDGDYTKTFSISTSTEGFEWLYYTHAITGDDLVSNFEIDMYGFFYIICDWWSSDPAKNWFNSEFREDRNTIIVTQGISYR